MDELRQSISEILVKWHMPTRQVAINEIMALIASYSREARINELEHLFDKNYITGIDLQPETVTTRINALKETKPEGKPNE